MSLVSFVKSSQTVLCILLNLETTQKLNDSQVKKRMLDESLDPPATANNEENVEEAGSESGAATYKPYSRDMPTYLKVLVGVGIGCAIYSFIFMIFGFAIPYGRFKAAEDFSYVGAYYVSPHVAVPIMHWVNWLAAIGIGALFIITPYGFNTVLVTAVFVLAAWLSTWILGMVWLFTLGDTGLKYETLPFSKFNESYYLVPEILPQYELFVEGSVKGSKYSYPCRGPSFFISAERWNEIKQMKMPLDEDLLSRSAFRIETSIVLTTDAAGDELLQNVSKTMRDCLGNPSKLKYAGVTIRGTIPGLNTNVVVTRDGKRPAVVNKVQCVFAGIFGGAAAYQYNVARALPVVSLTIQGEVILNASTAEGLTCDYGVCED